jgi:glycosyltransferase involved in cell wall biosynthesis
VLSLSKRAATKNLWLLNAVFFPCGYSVRIAMLVLNEVGRGTYWRAFHLARCLVERGHRVTLIAMARQRSARFAFTYVAGVSVVAAPDLLWGALRSGWDPYSTLLRTLLLRSTHYDLVHAFECRPSVLVPALATRQRRGTRLVMDWCDWFGAGGSVEERPNRVLRAVLRPVESFFEERFRHYADGTTVICSTLRAKALALGVAEDRLLDLRDGADVAGIRPGERALARAKLGMAAQGPIVVYLGQIFPRDAALMADAFRQLRSMRPDATLLLIGHVNQPIEALLGSSAGILRTGAVDYAAISTYLAASDLCWLPLCDSGANRGRWPLKLNDYMAAGRATVATAVGDVAEVMAHYPVGLLVAPDAVMIAEASCRLLTDGLLRERCEELGRAVAEQVFDWRLRAAELEQFYRKVLT